MWHPGERSREVQSLVSTSSQGGGSPQLEPCPPSIPPPPILPPQTPAPTPSLPSPALTPAPGHRLPERPEAAVLLPKPRLGRSSSVSPRPRPPCRLRGRQRKGGEERSVQTPADRAPRPHGRAGHARCSPATRAGLH